MPPPSWIGTSSPTAATMSRMTFSFLGRPAIAPFRSTMCRRFAPCFAQCRAMATGSSEKTVALLMSPCFRRTQRPSFRSIAGMMSTAGARLGQSGTPAHEVGEELQAGGLAFLGMELDGKNIIPGDGTGKGRAVHRGRGGEDGISRRGIVTMDKVETCAVGDAGPEGVRTCLHHFVPADVRDLKPGDRKARYVPGQDAKAGGISFFAALEQHLQADANTEEWFDSRCLDHGFTHPARAALAHAIGERTLSRHDDTVRAPYRFRVRSHQHFGLRGDALERLGHRAQIAHAVI